jgi:hypothetical protein
MALKFVANGDKTMRTIITLSALGLTLALGGATFANPAERSALLERSGHVNDQLQNHYRHKRYYRHDQDRHRGPDSGANRLQGRRDGLGTTPPQARKPALKPEPAVWRAPAVRERPQIL